MQVLLVRAFVPSGLTRLELILQFLTLLSAQRCLRYITILLFVFQITFHRLSKFLFKNKYNQVMSLKKHFSKIQKIKFQNAIILKSVKFQGIRTRCFQGARLLCGLLVPQVSVELCEFVDLSNEEITVPPCNLKRVERLFICSDMRFLLSIH